MKNNTDNSVLLLTVLKHALTQGERVVGFASRATEAVPLLTTTYPEYSIVAMIQVGSAKELVEVARTRYGVIGEIPIEGPDVNTFGVKSANTDVTEPLAAPARKGGRTSQGPAVQLGSPAPDVSVAPIVVTTPPSTIVKE